MHKVVEEVLVVKFYLTTIIFLHIQILDPFHGSHES